MVIKLRNIVWDGEREEVKDLPRNVDVEVSDEEDLKNWYIAGYDASDYAIDKITESYGFCVVTANLVDEGFERYVEAKESTYAREDAIKANYHFSWLHNRKVCDGMLRCDQDWYAKKYNV